MVSRGSQKGLSRYAHEPKFIVQSTLCQGQTTTSVRDLGAGGHDRPRRRAEGPHRTYEEDFLEFSSYGLRPGTQAGCAECTPGRNQEGSSASNFRS